MPLLVTAMDNNNARHSKIPWPSTWGGKQALQGHWHIQLQHKIHSTQATSPNGEEAICPVCMYGSACLSVWDAACRVPLSLARGRGWCEYSVASPGGRPGPGADHGG